MESEPKIINPRLSNPASEWSDLIAAVATPFGEGAVSMIRLSGPGAVSLVDSIFSGRVLLTRALARVQTLGKILDSNGNTLDEVLVTVFHAPSSYTGEEVVEISLHGGILVTRSVLQRILQAGVRMANPGEFTQRAFLNGKIDLTQAEAVMDLIQAKTSLALSAATSQLEGRLGRKISQIQNDLLELLAHVEAYIDFPEEDIAPDVGASLLSKLRIILDAISRLLQTADQGRILRDGIGIVLCGEPNVGKSSLLNQLLGMERAIVSHIPGTTRDTIEERIQLKGIPVRLIDTAGIRESADPVEQEGIERTRKMMQQADVILRVIDGTRPPAFSALLQNEILVINKIDQGLHPDWSGVVGVRISCLTGDGLEQIGEEIFQRVMTGIPVQENLGIAINARHQACLSNALSSVTSAIQSLDQQLAPEFVAEDLRASLDAVGEVVGKTDTEDLLGKIFSTFCIGK